MVSSERSGSGKEENGEEDRSTDLKGRGREACVKRKSCRVEILAIHLRCDIDLLSLNSSSSCSSST